MDPNIPLTREQLLRFREYALNVHDNLVIYVKLNTDIFGENPPLQMTLDLLEKDLTYITEKLAKFSKITYQIKAMNLLKGDCILECGQVRKLSRDPHVYDSNNVILYFEEIETSEAYEKHRMLDMILPNLIP
jgi:hypothetical protein